MGSWIYCLKDFLDMVENGILRDVAEEKEVEWMLKKLNETKTQMSLKTLEATIHLQEHLETYIFPCHGEVWGNDWLLEAHGFH